MRAVLPTPAAPLAHWNEVVGKQRRVARRWAKSQSRPRGMQCLCDVIDDETRRIGKLYAAAPSQQEQEFRAVDRIDEVKAPKARCCVLQRSKPPYRNGPVAADNQVLGGQFISVAAPAPPDCAIGEALLARHDRTPTSRTVIHYQPHAKPEPVVFAEPADKL